MALVQWREPDFASQHGPSAMRTVVSVIRPSKPVSSLLTHQYCFQRPPVSKLTVAFFISLGRTIGGRSFVPVTIPFFIVAIAGKQIGIAWGRTELLDEIIELVRLLGMRPN